MTAQPFRGLLITVDQDEQYAVKNVTKDPAAYKGDMSTLRWMYEQIGCSTVDVVRLADDLDMWVDDDGMYTHPINRLATWLAARNAPVAQYFYGNCLFLGGADSRGNTRGLSTAKGAQLIEQIMEVDA